MKIKINGVDADVQLENEKTVGDVLGALDAWLADAGCRLSGLAIDGNAVSVREEMEVAFARGLETIGVIDIRASTLSQLVMEGLIQGMEDIEDFQAAGFDEKAAFSGKWKESPQGRLLAEQQPDLFDWAVKTFSGEGAGPQALKALFEERLRELYDPIGEIGKTALLVDDLCARLEEFPLDIQTGKDARAAETVTIFSKVAEKVFRLYRTLKIEGFPIAGVTVEGAPIDVFIAEFNKALKELLDAYGQGDTVLIGDLAEYEMAPRLRGLHAALRGAVKGEDNEHRT